jgi:hypothetical protein
MQLHRSAVGSAILCLVVGVTGIASAAGKPGYPNTVLWGGRTWTVKSSQSRVGPGPNYFSASSDNVWVDSLDRLHLKITYRNGRWNCAEVIRAASFGYGAYTFEVATAVDDLDPNVVLGLFTWSDKGAFNHREIDVEIARWGNPSDPTNAQYVVQPYNLAGHLQRFTASGAAPTIHGFTWRSGRVDSPAPERAVGPRATSMSVPTCRSLVVRTCGLTCGYLAAHRRATASEVEVVVTAFDLCPESRGQRAGTFSLHTR